ncbi:autotransporter assembly complex protein TamA [Undibacterium rugosum]|uniref:BamA/TamA family outer membrane protein n=1 Tax=Undibacterium rugosum TaxID=2762291 RepID=A0A923KZ70_9BURK|nr:BamA/TamA family outer membrane protein [Undibacterium rugosum]MBC3934551.1 BamA/TamA family outer membrane protein [Undibacterium rugosum]MBR7777165.1 BamA/TamA family outer membrane protein [Undibacterium rugosum]
MMSYSRASHFLSVCLLSMLAQAGLAQETPATVMQSPATDSNTESDAPPRSLSGRLQLKAPATPWAALLREHIQEFSSSAESQNITPSLIRRLRQDIEGILATEGYFSPHIEFENPESAAASGAAKLPGQERDKLIHVSVDAGQRTYITQVGMRFMGSLADRANSGDEQAKQRRSGLIQDWGLPLGEVFRDTDWSDAKSTLLENLRADTYASAKITQSAVDVDADAAQASIRLEVDSGPAFRLGELRVSGLQRYPSWLLERYQPPRAGEPYSRARLLEFQRTLQNSAYFASVAVGVEPDPEKADAVPVDVSVVERKRRDLSFGTGYSSNTGFRGEIAYRDRNMLEKAWDLRSAIRIEQKRQVGYADVYLPPHDRVTDSFGAIIDRQDVSGVRTLRNAIGIKRTSQRGHIEQRLGLNLIREHNTIEGEPAETSKALVLSAGWTWRDVDDAFAPRKGEIYQLDLAVSEKTLLSDQRFIRSYGKYQRWIPIGNKSDSVILRAEVGQVVAPDSAGIPEEYLFRTGGSTTVRGYAYQSLGVQQGTAITGGRVMGVASAEYVHWLKDAWGVATFLDIGDAADTWRDLSMRQAIGVGARYRTPAGPIALDLAYGRQSKKVRLDFSIAIAF